MRAALYERVSTEEQKIHGLSIEAQKEALENYVKEHNLSIAGHYTDAGISGQKPISKRPALQQLLSDVQAGKVDIILFTRLDRWSRKVKEYYKAQDILDKHKVPWRAITEDYETETPSGEFKVNIMLSVNQNEAQRAAERVKTVFDAKKARGEVCSGSVPPGIRITPDKHLEAEEPEASMMKDVFREFIACRSSYAAQRYMANKYGVLRDTTTFRKLLKNQKYRGLVIDEKTFDLAQEILKVRSQRNAPQGRIYLFTGLVTCGTCRHNMIAYQNKGYIYYRCGRHFTYGDCEFKKHIKEEYIEEFLLSNFIESVKEYNANLVQKKKVQIDTASIKKKMDKLTDLYMADLINREKYEHDYRELQVLLNTPETNETPIDVKQAQTALDMYSQLDRKGKKEFWSRTIKEITVYDKNSFSFTLR